MGGALLLRSNKVWAILIKFFINTLAENKNYVFQFLNKLAEKTSIEINAYINFNL